eukprot:9481740-Pyramimonas_sp.AAC.1
MDYPWTYANKTIRISTIKNLVLHRYRSIYKRVATSTLQHLPSKFSPHAGKRIREVAHPGPPGLDRALQLLGLGPTDGNRTTG